MELFRGGWVVLSWMQLSLLLLSLHFVLFSTTTCAQGIVIRIDSGGFSNFTDQYNETWIQDSFFTGGSAASVSQPGNFTKEVERTIRYFPTTGGKKHCYLVPVPNGRYFVRMFFVYDNYDNKGQAPNFDVSVENTVVFSWRSWPGNLADVGAYSDLTTYVQDGEASVCFYSLSTNAPLIGALEIVQIDPLSYDSATTGQDVILVNYGRLTGGNTSFGAGLTNDSDVGGRAWEVDTIYSTTSKQVLMTNEVIRGSNVAPNYFPNRLYQSARTLLQPQPNPVIEYYFQVDSRSDYMIWMHFAEIEPSISAPKQRVFDIEVNGLKVFPNVDIFAAVQNYAAYDLNYTVRNLSDTPIHLRFIATTGVPLVSGLEILAISPIEIATNPAEGLAMQNLKTSLQVPDRKGWNGDPCAPSSWDAWDGVSCTLSNDGTTLGISQIDLSNEGLTGIMSDSITQLSYLLNLNLSSNQITGSIPTGLGSNPLENVDLSSNSLTGTIPDSLGSPQLRKVLLNENLLSGQVPESLYSIGVEGGFINLSLNKGLCGIPSLPDCPNFWSKGGMSSGAKVGIAFGVLAAVSLLTGLIWIYIKRRHDKDDYNFGLPHQLAMRHKRYMQYRATLQSNNEDGHMMRVSPSKYGFSTTMNTL